jgi:hypothetical protein
MPINLNLDPQTNLGRVLLDWHFWEFKHHNRPKSWWITAGIITGLLVIYAVVSANFLFALIILIGAVLLINEYRRRPRRLHCQITSNGLAVGKKFWRYNELANYWIAYHPPEVTNLYILPKNPLDPRVTIPLVNMNPLRVRKILNKYLEEDLSREDEPTSEALTRLLKLQ